jgi:hypothetical protein
MEMHTQLTEVVTQNMISSKGNKLPPGVQQLLDAYTHIVQMASQIMTNNNNISPSNPNNDKAQRTCCDKEPSLQTLWRYRTYIKGLRGAMP